MRGGIAAVVGVAALLALVWFYAQQEGPRASEPVVDEAGAPFSIDALAGPAPQAAPAFWQGEAVLVLKLDAALIRERWEGLVPHPHEDGTVLAAFSQKSTVRGCDIGLRIDGDLERLDRDVDGSFDGLLVDICSPEVAWDPYTEGRPLLGVYHEKPDCTSRPEDSRRLCEETFTDIEALPILDLEKVSAGAPLMASQWV